MQKELIEKNPILKLSIEFSLLLIDYCELLQQNKKFVISRQLLRSGTAIGANCMETQNAESKVDFIHKIKIVLKELRETKVWLILILRTELVSPRERLEPLIQECDELISIFVQSVKTAKSRSTTKIRN